MQKLRAVFRTILLLANFTLGGLDFFFRYWLTGRASSIPARAEWLQRWCRNYLRFLNGRLTFEGTPPTRGILVSNHLSYVDILTYGAICPMVFVSKSEVRSWPVIGALTRCAGTLFIQRQKKGDVLPLAEQMAKVVEAGVMVALFLEGTSTGGDVVLPFRSSLLSTAEEQDWRVTPAWVHYSLKSGSVADEICYWREMTLFPHLVNLLCKKEGFDAHVCFGEPLTGKMDRKEMAKELHTRVCQLRETFLVKEKQGTKDSHLS